MSVRIDRRRGIEGGFALLLTLLALILAGTTLFLSVARQDAGIETAAIAERARAVGSVRAALLGYAIAGGKGSGDSGSPGALPCPDLDGDGLIGEDTDGDGASEGNLACQANVEVWLGRVPYRTLGLSLADMPNGQPIWYALDPDFVDWQTDVNPATEPSLEIEGDPNRYAAVLIVPGDPLVPEGASSPQTRPSSEPEAFLEGLNADASEGRFSDCDRDREDCNDRVIGITADSLLDTVRQRLLTEVGAALREYRDASSSASPWLPWAADPSNPGSPGAPAECEDALWSGLLPAENADSSPDHWGLCGDAPYLPDWIVDNGWNRYIFYKVADGCHDSATACGNATNSDLLTLDGEAGQAVVFGVPEDMGSVDFSANTFSNPGTNGATGRRFDAIAASES